MRVGILTLPFRNNYGGILQNYALQQVLLALGHKPYTIDYRIKGNIIDKIILITKQLIQSLLLRKFRLSLFRIEIDEKFKFDLFIKRHIKKTLRTVVNPSWLIYLYRFNVVITGSDQIFRPKYAILKLSYLSFFKSDKMTKLAYAASFGVSDWEYTKEQTDDCKRWISDFKAVSFREQSGVRLCEKFLNRESAFVLDPTLLLKAEDYDKIIDEIKTDKDYILVYGLDLDDSLMDQFKMYHEPHKYEYVYIGADSKANCSIDQWLSFIKNAQLVITDSFHGMLFSILFHKSFYVLINENRGGDRFISFLKLIDLEDRVLDKINDLDFEGKKIDWDNVDRTIDEYREISIQFLKMGIENGKTS